PCLAPPASSPLSLHDALPIFGCRWSPRSPPNERERFEHHGLNERRRMPRSEGEPRAVAATRADLPACRSFLRSFATRSVQWSDRSEEHTSELQSRENLVCRLL